jgi:hypothetical protein
VCHPLRRVSAPVFRFTLLAASLLAALLVGTILPSSLLAQSIYLDTNGDGVHSDADVVAPSGPTVLDVWLRTDANADGTPAVCATGDGALTVSGYQLVVRATNGTVAWGALVNAIPEFTVDLGGASGPTELAGGFGGGPALVPGTYRLATVTITVASGTPSIEFLPQSNLSSRFKTRFDSSCPGNDASYSLQLGSDWSDAEGAPYGGTVNLIPVLAPVADVAMGEGEIVDRALAATDGDGEPLQFVLVSGPAYASVTTVDAGAGAATGRARLAPGFADAGSAQVTVAARDAVSSDEETFHVLVNDTNRAPNLLQPPDVMAGEGYPTSQEIQAEDPDGDVVSFRLLSGPIYASVTSGPSELGRAFGAVTFTPGYSDAGMANVTVGARDAIAETARSFSVMVRETNRPPALALPATLAGPEGEPLEFIAAAPDPDGQIPSLDATGLPAGASFVDLMNGTAAFRWAPGFNQAGDYLLTVTADDRAGQVVSGAVSLQVTDVTAAVALARPEDMSVFRGAAAEQPLHAFDADGGALAFSLASGPAFVAVETVDPGATSGFAVGRILVTPGFGDAGATTAVAQVTDGVNRAERGFSVVVLEAGQAPGRTPFVPPFAPLGVGLTPHTVTSADLDRDGANDLIVANLNSNSISVLRGHGDGTFEMRMDYPTAAKPHTVAVRDLNGDGVPDLAVNQVAANSIASFLGRGDGTFAPRVDCAMGGSPAFLGLQDFDRDGIVDVAATNQTAGALTLFHGRGDGTFERVAEYPTGAHSHGMAIGDVNQDGRADVVVANGEAATVSVLLGRGDGTFEAKRDFTTSAPHTVSLGDLDNDGKPDVVIVNFDSGTVSILHGNGDGTFAHVEDIATGTDAHGATIADVDGDGWADVLVANQGAGTLSVLMGRGGGAFAPKTDFTMPAGAHSVTVADLNGDGLPDAAVSSIVANLVTVLLNRRPTVLDARAFAPDADRLLILRAAKPTWGVSVEAMDDAFSAEDITAGSVTLEADGVGSIGRIHALADRALRVGDRDRNGVPDAAFVFAREDLRALFDAVIGRRAVDAIVEGALTDGKHFRAPVRIDVVGDGPPGKPERPHVSPNPLNPSGVLWFDVLREGPVTVSLFDARGRMVQRVVEAKRYGVGRHAVPIGDGAPGGARLASGVYFFSVRTVGLVETGRFVVLK